MDYTTEDLEICLFDSIQVFALTTTELNLCQWQHNSTFKRTRATRLQVAVRFLISITSLNNKTKPGSWFTSDSSILYHHQNCRILAPAEDQEQESSQSLHISNHHGC